MGKIRSAFVTGLAVALGLGGATVAGQAEAVGPNCKVGVTTDRYVEVETVPEITVSLTDCGSGSLVVDVRSSSSTRSVSLGTVVDGEKNVILEGVSDLGNYDVRARVDSLATAWTPITIISWPTAHSAGWKPVGQTTYTWGRFDTTTPLTVWTEVNTPNGWSRSQQATTDAKGGYTMPLTYGANTPGVYQWRVGGRYPSGQVFYSDPFILERIQTATASSAGVKELGATTYVWGKFDVNVRTAVWTEVETPSGWSRSQTATTTSSGNYTIPLTYGASTPGVYRWRVAGDIDSKTVLRTPEFSFRRVKSPSISTAGAKRVGEETYVWGSFDGTGQPMTVWTEVLTSNGWSRSQTAKTTDSGFYSIPLTYGSNLAGTTRWRVVAQYPEGILSTVEATLRRY